MVEGKRRCWVTETEVPFCHVVWFSLTASLLHNLMLQIKTNPILIATHLTQHLHCLRQHLCRLYTTAPPGCLLVHLHCGYSFPVIAKATLSTPHHDLDLDLDLEPPTPAG